MKQIKIPISTRLSGAMRVSYSGTFIETAGPAGATNNLRGNMQHRVDGKFSTGGTGKRSNKEHDNVTDPAPIAESIFGKSGELMLMRGHGLYNYLSEEFDDDNDLQEDLDEGFCDKEEDLPKVNPPRAGRLPSELDTTNVTGSGMPRKSPKLNNRTV